MKTMVLYYSKSGKTQKLAEKIQSAFGCDILEVEAEKPYGNFLFTIIRMIREKSKGIIPASKTEIPNLESYDAVFIGYPVWASDLPVFFAGFVQKCNLKGKTVIPFATSGGSGVECTMENIRRVCPESKIVLPFHYETGKKDNFDDWTQSIRRDVMGG